MFSVIFEVNPRTEEWDAYLETAKMLRPDLEQVDGFVDNVRYRSLTREGWVLSLSGWRDEKSVVRWRTRARHHGAQSDGRSRIMRDYHLRVGEITRDTRLPAGHVLVDQRLDGTAVGDASTVTLIDGQRDAAWVKEAGADAVAGWLGLDKDAAGLTAWEVFDAVLTPGEIILVMSWRDPDKAISFENTLSGRDDVRVRRVRIVRDYGMYDRREAPQYYPDATGRATIHA
jgi:heme-degrading monooxygenase HmoA